MKASIKGNYKILAVANSNEYEIEAEDIRITEEKKETKTLRVGDVTIHAEHSYNVCVNSTELLFLTEESFCRAPYDKQPILFNLLDIATEMGKADLKNERTEKIRDNGNGFIDASPCIGESVISFRIAYEGKNGTEAESRITINKSDAFRFAAQLLALCK